MNMRTRFLTMLAALLLSVGAFAQSSTPIKGDVNGDGVVDVADINAVIEIMKNGGGTGGNSPYYWYVGVEKPTSASNPAANLAPSGWKPVFGDGQSRYPGWRFIGNTLDNISEDSLHRISYHYDKDPKLVGDYTALSLSTIFTN